MNSTQIYDATDSAIKMPTTITSSLDKPASGDKLTLRWSNIPEVAARTLRIFNTECQLNELPRSGTWLVGSTQYLSVFANYPSMEEERLAEYGRNSHSN